MAESVRRQNAKQIEEAMKDVEGDIDGILKSAFRVGVQRLDGDSPIFTGWYKRNHRVVVGNTDEVELEPPQKPDEAVQAARDGNTGQLDPGNLVRRESSSIARISLKKGFAIANAVPYAHRLEEKGTPGRQGPLKLYESAATAIANRISQDGGE